MEDLKWLRDENLIYALNPNNSNMFEIWVRGGWRQQTKMLSFRVSKEDTDALTQKIYDALTNIDRLRASNKELLEALELAYPEIVQLIDDIGGCDHHVGICCCGLISLAEQMKEGISNAKRGK